MRLVYRNELDGEEACPGLGVNVMGKEQRLVCGLIGRGRSECSGKGPGAGPGVNAMEKELVRG